MTGTTKPTCALKPALSTLVLFSCILPFFLFHDSGLVAAEKSIPQKSDAYLVICGEADRDVFQINGSTVRIGLQASSDIRPLTRGSEYRDVNGDGFLDLLLPLKEDYSTLEGTKGLNIIGSTYSGIPIGGSWYFVNRDRATGAILALSAGSVQAAGPTCTLGPFRRAFADAPVGGRLIPNGITSVCGVAKPCPGTQVTIDTPGPNFNSFQDVFRINMSTSPTCVTVTTTAINCNSGVHTTAIVGDHISYLNMCDGYAGDSGVGTGQGGTTSFSFTVPPGDLYSLVFTGETPGTQCADFSYTISISPCSVRCLQDDSSGDQIIISSERGLFLFRSCQPSLTLSGLGTAYRKGSIVTLTDYEPQLRVVARFDESAKKGTATVIYLPLNFRSTITDRNITDNTCECGNR